MLLEIYKARKKDGNCIRIPKRHVCKMIATEKELCERLL